MKSHFFFSFLRCLLAIVFPVGSSGSRAQEAASSLLPDLQIREVATQILKSAAKANCIPQECRILVANFTFGSGLTSQLGIQLADQFSQEFSSEQDKIQMIDRSALRAYLEQQRIAGALLNNEKAVCWLGKQLGATAVLTGLIEENASSLQVKIVLLSCDKDNALSEELTLPVGSQLKDALVGIEAFPKDLPGTDKPTESPIPRSGVNGVTQPGCLYCPNPNPTKAGRDAKFNGAVLIEVVVSDEGRAAEVRIVRGVPYGLNEEAIHAVQNWKFKPSTFNGTPVTAKATVEIGFRLN